MDYEQRLYSDDYGNRATITSNEFGITLVVNGGFYPFVHSFTNLEQAKRAMRTITGTKWREVYRKWEYVS